MAHLAGAAAVELVTGTTDNGATADYRHATAALAAATNSTPSDRDLRQAYHTATLLLQRHKAALNALAEQLAYEQTLSYSAVVAVCAAFGRDDDAVAVGALRGAAQNPNRDDSKTVSV